MVSDNDVPRPRGRPFNLSEAETVSKLKGEILRNSLMLAIAGKDLRRPLGEGAEYNDCGHAHMKC